MSIYIPKLYVTGYSLFIGLLCWLGSQTTALGLPKISHDTNTRSAANLSLPGSVSAVEANKCYRIVSRLSGKALGISGTAQSDGDKLTQQADANKLTQGWRFTATDGGYYSIQVLSTQKGIQVSNSSTADDALLEQWTYWGGSHQQWRLVRNADGYFTITSRNANKAITVRNASTAEGAQISQMTLGSGQNQQWSIEERSCTATATATNQAPVAVATSTPLTGSSPLSVTFTGNKSYDPDGDPITYQWDFGDGSSYSTEANPVKVFTAKAGAQGVGLILNYTVQLTVIDSKGLRSPVQTFSVRLNNGNPTVQIMSPVNNAKYPLDKSTSYTLGATVTGNTIQSQIWQVKLRHNNRDQLVKTLSGASPVVDISPAGCGGEDYYYVITVKVTDYNNLSAQDSVKIYPDCNSPNLSVTGLTALPFTSVSTVQLTWTNPTIPFDDILVVGKAGSGFTDIPLDPTYTANASITGNGSNLYGGKVLYQGTGTSVSVTDLTGGQLYYFRVYTRKGNGWSGGVEVSATPRTSNRPPVPIVTYTPLTGTPPLSVTFTGDKSYDPDGDPLTYIWDFGDGSSSSAANPVHVFTPIPGKGGSPQTSFTVRLLIRDNKGGQTDFQTFFVSVSNPAPTAKITTPVNLSKYALDKATSYTLAATVTDDVPSRLTYFWQGKLRINGKDQYPTTMTSTNPVFTVSPVGCDGVDDYYYIFTLKVTDVGNLTAQDSVKIYPDCNSPKLNVTGLTATTLTSNSVRLNWTNPTIPFEKVLVMGKPGSTLVGEIPDPNSGINAVNSSFTANASSYPADAVRALYYGTENSVVVTDLTPGQLYYFRVSARAGGWSGGVEVSATPTSATTSSPGSVSAVEANKCYRLVSRLSGKVLGIDGSAQSDGDKLTQQANANKLTQSWRFTATDGGYYSIQVLSTQKGIQVSNSSTADDALLEQWTYWGGSHQQWRLVRNTDGYFTITSRNANKAITVRNASTAEGAPISQMTLGSAQNQQWSIEERTCTAGARLGASETGVTFKLWPNPAREHVLIDLSPAIGQPVGLKLHDLMGRTLQQAQLEVAPTEPYRLTIDQVPNGLYLIQLTPAGELPTTLRLLIQR
ncbi:RICIN domain-containing protein [Spirosoma arboris]|nr:RICIN domain-containing protein [Spirosoma arboris]